MAKRSAPLRKRYFLVSIAFLCLIIAIIALVTRNTQSKFKYGVTFSPHYATSLGLDWQKVYIHALDQLKARYLRLPTFWNIIEAEEGIFDFSEVDFMLNEAEKRDAKVLLTIGVRQPRWPECHVPEWAKQLNTQQRQKKALEFVEVTVERYKDRGIIWGWQVENEPLLAVFGECDPVDREFLKREVSLVKKLDPARPIVITDSGELRFWRTPMELSDIFGTTLYRTVHNKIFGFFKWPLVPALYTLKSNIIRTIFAPHNQKTIISELQAEPWSPQSLEETPLKDQLRVFSIKDFKDNINFAQGTGFDEIYLWGIEWWYWAEKQGHPEYLQYAQQLFE